LYFGLGFNLNDRFNCIVYLLGAAAHSTPWLKSTVDIESASTFSTIQAVIYKAHTVGFYDATQ